MIAVNSLTANLISLLRGLRKLGFDLGPDDLVWATRALESIDVRDQRRFYQALKCVWCRNFAESTLFEYAFFEWLVLLGHPEPGAAVQETYLTSAAKRHRQEGVLAHPSWYPDGSPATPPASLELRLLAGSSRQEVLAHKPLDRLTEDEIELLTRLYRPKRPLTRSSYLPRPGLSGRSWNPQETMRSGREGSEWLRLYYDNRPLEPLSLTVLLDMSGSMAGHHRPLLQFLHAMMRHQRHLSVYAFSTRLTRVTESLKMFHIDRALTDISDRTPDRGGGTRIGASLKTLWERERGRGVTNRSTLVLVSDGFEAGDENTDNELGRWLERWQRTLSGRVHWWNPLGIRDPGSQTTPSIAALASHTMYASVPNFKALEEAWLKLDCPSAL